MNEWFVWLDHWSFFKNIEWYRAGCLCIPRMIFNFFMSKKCKLRVLTILEENLNFKDILPIVYQDTKDSRQLHVQS